MNALAEVRRREPEAVRGRITAAAVEIFAARGFDGASLDLIARRSGASTQLIVYHFKSKLDLWRTVVETLGRSADQTMAEILAHTDLPVGERLRRVIALRLRTLAETPELHRMIVIDAYADSDRLRWLIDAHVRASHQSLMALICEAQALGVVRELDPARLRYVILGVAALPTVAAEYRALTGRDAAAPAEVQASLDFITRLIFKD